MYGAGMGKMRVYIKIDGGPMHEVWRKAGNQSQGWKMDLIANLNPSDPFQVLRI